jgi:hypothetical protein
VVCPCTASRGVWLRASALMHVSVLVSCCVCVGCVWGVCVQVEEKRWDVERMQSKNNLHGAAELKYTVIPALEVHWCWWLLAFPCRPSSLLVFVGLCMLCVCVFRVEARVCAARVCG